MGCYLGMLKLARAGSKVAERWNFSRCSPHSPTYVGIYLDDFERVEDRCGRTASHTLPPVVFGEPYTAAKASDDG